MGNIPPGVWYQEATINGVKMPQRRTEDTTEKRWENLVEPLVRKDGGVCIDLGCNAGFYSRKMVDKGFDVIGVEREPEFLAHARYWEEQDPKGVKIVEADINDYDLPCASVVILAQVHYWMTPEQIKALVDKLKRKAVDVIVVGSHVPLKASPDHPNARVHKSQCDLETLRGYFEGWDEMDVESDVQHFSMLFRNPTLFVMGVNDITREHKEKTDRLYPAFEKFVITVYSPDLWEYTGDYYDYLEWRGFDAYKTMEKHVDLIFSILDDGIKEPLTLIDDCVIEGHHRLIIARQLGIKKVVCRSREHAAIRLPVS